MPRRAILVSALLALAACAGAGRPATVAPSVPTVALLPVPPRAVPVAATSARPAAPVCTPGVRPSIDRRSALVIAVLQPTVARRRPAVAAAAVLRLEPKNAYGLRQIVLALDERLGADCTVRWYRVKLPMRPNGRTGWIPARSLRVETVRSRIVADLSERRLWVYRDGAVVARIAIATGAADTPTPTGLFYVDSRFRISTAGSAFGPAILGIAAYSEAAQGWARGNPIAIHGTSADDSIGTAASHGCLRVHNRDILRLMELVPAGSPVLIRA